MSAQSISVLKSYFETGDVPTEAQFADLIDTIFSMVATATKNQANGVAGLDGSALIAIAQLQAIIDDASNAATNKTWSITKVKGLLDTLTANIAAINLILESNDINLDDVQEIVDAVKALQTSASLLAGKIVDTSGRATGKILEYDETLNSGQGGYKHVEKPTGTGSTPPTWQPKTFGTISLAAGELAQSAFYIPATGNFAISAITSSLATGEAQSIVLKVQLSNITSLDLTLPANVTEDGLAITDNVKEITGTEDSWQLVVFERNHLGNWDIYLKGETSSSGGPAVAETYADIAARDADVANRTAGEIVKVTDASADATVDAGYAYYEFEGGTSWRKLSEEESMDVESSNNEPSESTGTSVKFDIERIYGLTSPETGNITLDATGAKLGMVQLMRHNHTSIPTFTSVFKKSTLSGNYATGVLNYIYFEYISSTEIVYTIHQTI